MKVTMVVSVIVTMIVNVKVTVTVIRIIKGID